MAIRELDRKRIERLLTDFCDRVPMHVRDKLRHGYRVSGSTVELFEQRPVWDDPSRWLEESVVRWRYVASREVWQLYCVHQDLKWHAYERLPVAGSFEILFREVERDPTGIFWG